MNKGILVIDIPNCCGDCFALDDSSDYPRCIITQEQRGYRFKIREQRMDTCPLKPVFEKLEDNESIYYQLGEYKDTGLTPQEIEQMKARMPLHQWAGESPDKKSIFGVTVSKIMEWVRAEKEKRLIILNEHDLCEDNAICCDDNCQECAKRVYKAYCKERDKLLTK